MRAIVAGPDAHGIADALGQRDVDVTRIEGPLNRPALEEAGATGAALLVLTDMADATGIPIAKDVNPDIRVVTYAPDDLPDFASRQTDLAVDPALLDAAAVAEELVQ